MWGMYERRRGPAGLPERLHRLGKAMGYRSAAAFAKALHVHPNRLNNVMRLAQPLSRKLEEIICAECPGVTRDWLRDGNPRGLDPRMAVRLGEKAPGGKNNNNPIVWLGLDAS